MGLFDVLSNVGTVVSPGLEAYGKGQLDIANLIASLQNKRQERNFELAKLAEESRQFGVTSDLSAKTLAETMRANTRKEQPNTLEEAIVQGLLRTGKLSPELRALWRNKYANFLEDEWLGFGEDKKAVPSGGSTSMTAEEYGLKALEAGATLDIIRQGLQKNYGVSDDEINSRFKELLGVGSPIPKPTGIPSTPGPKVGGVGLGPLTQGNPQGGLASLSGSPIDFQRFFPRRKEEILPRLQGVKNRALGMIGL